MTRIGGVLGDGSSEVDWRRVGVGWIGMECEVGVKCSGTEWSEAGRTGEGELGRKGCSCEECIVRAGPPQVG